VLDKIINDHVDKQEEIIDQAENDLDVLMKGLKIDALIEAPLETLVALVNEMRERIVEEYAQQAVKNGNDFAKIVNKLRRTGDDIEVDDTNDPMLNEGEVENGERDKENG